MSMTDMFCRYGVFLAILAVTIVCGLLVSSCLTPRPRGS